MLSATISGVATTVLIVDDHPSFRGSARAILEADGFEVVGEADTGTGGLDAARTLRPDVVLLDVQLPDRSGFDVCCELVGWDGDAPAVVLVSSRDGCDYGDRIAASGARGFVAKAELSGDAVARLIE
jgi:DNA-binding NarL/FixJ family response regulator